MFSLLALHAIAAKRGDGLHPKLLDALRRQEARPAGGLTLVPLPGLALERVAVNKNDQGLARSASHASNPAIEITPPPRTAS